MGNKRNSFEEKKRRFFHHHRSAPASEFDYEILFILASLQLNDGIFSSRFFFLLTIIKRQVGETMKLGEGRWDVVNANKNYSRSWTINYAVWDEKAIESHSETGSWVSSDVNNVIKHSSNRVWLELSNFYLTWSDTHTLGAVCIRSCGPRGAVGYHWQVFEFLSLRRLCRNEKKYKTFNSERRHSKSAKQEIVLIVKRCRRLSRWCWYVYWRMIFMISSSLNFDFDFHAVLLLLAVRW